MSEQEKRLPADELPIGFAMALAQNGPAMAAFAGLDAVAREELVTRARLAKSKADMRELVGSIGGNPPLV
ncbi:MAG: hypothetical protein ACI3XP_01880 [Eubacteriales bacterium]